VARLAKEREHPGPGVSPREQSARERAAREREERVAQALEYLPQAQAAKERQQQTRSIPQRSKVTALRTSSTDPEVRVMKMPDGGFRPAYNIQLATDGDSGVIVGVEVVNTADSGQAAPMEEQVLQRTGEHPKCYLMDGGFATREDITTLERRGVTVYAPVRLARNKPGEERYQARYEDSPEVVADGSEEAKAMYRQRGSTAEWANAQVRQHGVPNSTCGGWPKSAPSCSW